MELEEFIESMKNELDIDFPYEGSENDLFKESYKTQLTGVYRELLNKDISDREIKQIASIFSYGVNLSKHYSQLEKVAEIKIKLANLKG